MCNEQLGFGELLVQILNSETGTARIHAMYCVMVLALSFDNSTYLLSHSLGLVKILNNLAKNCDSDDQLNATKCLGNLSGNLSPRKNAMRLIEVGTHAVALELIVKAGIIDSIANYIIIFN
jgi:hypothetical protein